MKKILYILIALIILGGVSYFLFSKYSGKSNDITHQDDPEKGWYGYFPEQVLEYTDGEVKEITRVEPDMSRFEDEVFVMVEDTSLEQLSEYVEKLESKGWEIGYQSPQEEDFYNIQLSLETRSITAGLNSEGVLRFTSCIEE